MRRFVRTCALTLILLTVLLTWHGGRQLLAPGHPVPPAGPGQDPSGGQPREVLPEAEHLVDLAELAPEIILDLRYARADNILGRPLYEQPRALLARGTAHKLINAAEALRREGWAMVVWDAYRPLSVQRLLWQAMPDPRFVADPAIGSRHNRAAAVDVTLIRLDGGPLPMPTDFDHFGPEARADWAGHPQEVRAVALRLREIMIDSGFFINPDEWWHFSDEEWRRYPLLDLPLDTVVPAP